MRYEIHHARRPGTFVIESSDIVRIAAYGQSAVRITLTAQSEYFRYVEDDGWMESSDDQFIMVHLTPTQVQEMVEQHRAQSSSYCAGDGTDNCYDYGKALTPPAKLHCQRCQLLQSCQKATLGDFRKVKPVQPIREASCAQSIGLLISICLAWYAFYQAVAMKVQLDSSRAALSVCRQEMRFVKPAVRVGER